MVTIVPAAPGSYAIRIDHDRFKAPKTEDGLVKDVLQNYIPGVTAFPVVLWEWAGAAWPLTLRGEIAPDTILGVYQLNEGSADVYRLFADLVKAGMIR